MCLAIIFIIELAVGIAAIAFKSDLEMVLQNTLETSIKKSGADDVVAWDNVQRKLQCCGVNGPADWVDHSKNRTLRTSCCRPEHIDPETNDCRLAYPLFKVGVNLVKESLISVSYLFSRLIFVVLIPKKFLLTLHPFVIAISGQVLPGWLRNEAQG